MGKVKLAYRAGSAEVFCPTSQQDEFVFGKCHRKDDSDCPYHEGHALLLDGQLELFCSHPDIENCNSWSETNL